MVGMPFSLEMHFVGAVCTIFGRCKFITTNSFRCSVCDRYLHRAHRCNSNHPAAKSQPGTRHRPDAFLKRVQGTTCNGSTVERELTLKK